MTDRELDRLLQTLSPIEEEWMAEMDLREARAALAAKVATRRAPTRRGPSISPRLAGRNARSSARAGAVGMLAAAAVLALVLVLGGGGSGSRPAFAAAAVRVAEANARLLVGAPGWRVVRADEFTVNEGEMTFSDGRHELDLNWRPANFYRRYVRDRSSHARRSPVTVLGRSALRFTDRPFPQGGQTITTILPPHDGSFVEVRSDNSTKRGYMRVLDSLHAVDVRTWLAALPPSTVQPQDRSAVVEKLLTGVPLPPGFDREALRDGSSVRDLQQFRGVVLVKVTCGWLDAWIAARRDGNAAAARAAVAAMASSDRWTQLERPEDGLPSFISEFARETARQPANAPLPVPLNHYRHSLACSRIDG